MNMKVESVTASQVGGVADKIGNLFLDNGFDHGVACMTLKDSAVEVSTIESREIVFETLRWAGATIDGDKVYLDGVEIILSFIEE